MSHKETLTIGVCLCYLSSSLCAYHSSGVLKMSLAFDQLRKVWDSFDLPCDALHHVSLNNVETGLPSSFAIGAAAQTTIAATALAAAEIWHLRTGSRQHVFVDKRDALLECTAHFAIDGVTPPMWDKFSGLYPCGCDVNAPGWVRIHANFAHHRDGALQILGLGASEGIERSDVESALRGWTAEQFESAAAEAGLVVAALRSFDEWDRHPQSLAIANLPLLTIEKIDDSPPREWSSLSDTAESGLPLQGLRALELTRILAGPVAGRTLAAYGAEVMLINSPHLPNIAAIADTSRGKISAQLDLKTSEGAEQMRRLIGDTHIFMQGYRPGALQGLGFGPSDVARLRPGVIYVSLSAYGDIGPWGERRGFDSLVQSATGLNLAEAQAFRSNKPKALPVQILDYASGFLMAFGAAAALLRQRREGGSWHVRISLAQTAQWLRGLGQALPAISGKQLEPRLFAKDYSSGFGRLTAMPHAAQFSKTPPRWDRPSMPPGSDRPQWPAASYS